MPTNNTFLVLLAGGKSSRMGTDKAQLVLNSKTLLDHQIGKFCVLSDIEEVYVSGHRPNYKHIPDQLPGRGPLEGIRSSIRFLLSKTSDFKMFVVPIDMPLLGSFELNQLRSQASAKSSPDLIKFQNFEMPIYILNPKNSLEKIEEIYRSSIESSDWSLRSLISKSIYHEITVHNTRAFSNTNTPKEWIDAIS